MKVVNYRNLQTIATPRYNLFPLTWAVMEVFGTFKNNNHIFEMFCGTCPTMLSFCKESWYLFSWYLDDIICWYLFLLQKKLYYIQFSYFLIFCVWVQPGTHWLPKLHLSHTKLSFIFKFGAYIAKLSKKQTPPISRHFALAPTVSANWREYCISI